MRIDRRTNKHGEANSFFFFAILRKVCRDDLGYVKRARPFAFVASFNRGDLNISGSPLHNSIS
jgi:hypothetical protein